MPPLNLERLFESFYLLCLSNLTRGPKTGFRFAKMGKKRKHAYARVPLEIARRRLVRYALSPREEQVVFLLLRGFSNKEIASRCTLTVETVKEYLKNIYKKAEIHGRMALLAHLFGTDEA